MLKGISGAFSPGLTLARSLFGAPRVPSLQGERSSTPASSSLASVNRNRFAAQLEKHLNDVSRGEGYLSRKTGRQVRALDIQNGLNLAELDPSSSTLYAGLTSGFSYAQNARLVNSVGGSTETSFRLKELSEIDQEKATEEIIELFSGRVATPPEVAASRYSEVSEQDT